MTPQLRKYLKFLLRFAVSCGLLFWLFSSVELTEIIRGFKVMPIWAWVAAIALYLLSQILSSIRWAVICKALGFEKRLLDYFRYYFVGMFFNLFMPTSIGGDLMKIWFLAGKEPLKLRASYSVLADRAFGFLAMFTLASAVLALWPDLLPAWLGWVVFGVYGVMVSGVLLFPLFFRQISLFCSNLQLSLARRLASPVILSFWRCPGASCQAFGLSLLLQFCCMASVAVLATGFSAGGLPMDIPSRFFFVAFPLVAVIMVLPVSISGFGVREGGFVYLLGLKGVPQEVAISLSLAFFGIQAATSLIGGIIYVTGMHRAEIPVENEVVEI